MAYSKEIPLESITTIFVVSIYQADFDPLSEVTCSLLKIFDAGNGKLLMTNDYVYRGNFEKQTLESIITIENSS